MKRSVLHLLLSLCAVPALAELDINGASQAELERLRGVGPQLSGRILAARAQRPFSDWEDLRGRVAGLGTAQATRLSVQGLTVAGAAYAATDSMLMPLKSPREPLPSGTRGSLRGQDAPPR
ncbi:MAG: ComEA family DNA-binding protein [Rubrivivax sp.]